MHREARYYCVNTGANELHGTEYEETAPKLWGQTRTEAPSYVARHVFNTCFVSVMLGDQIKKTRTRFYDILANAALHTDTHFRTSWWHCHSLPELCADCCLCEAADAALITLVATG